MRSPSSGLQCPCQPVERVRQTTAVLVAQLVGREAPLDHRHQGRPISGRKRELGAEGEPRPIETSADRLTLRYSYGPFTGGPERMTAKATTRISYEWFGDCEPHATDTVRETYAWVMTPIDRT